MEGDNVTVSCTYIGQLHPTDRQINLTLISDDKILASKNLKSKETTVNKSFSTVYPNYTVCRLTNVPDGVGQPAAQSFILNIISKGVYVMKMPTFNSFS